jgi:tRNA (cytidine/uridine-2'-O-)-methyltransferase
MPSLVLYQPDIPQNLGAIMRLCACFGTDLHIIEPCGFPLDDKRIKRAGMDYIEHVTLHRHSSPEAFLEQFTHARKILMTTKSSAPLYDVNFLADDLLIFGRESAGVPDDFHAQMNIRVRIPMKGEVRSLNLATSAAIVLAEATRQLDNLSPLV